MYTVATYVCTIHKSYPLLGLSCKQCYISGNEVIYIGNGYLHLKDDMYR